MKINNYIKSPVAKNIFSLGIFQLINYLTPLIAIPYIIHQVGPFYFGVLSFAQALVKYFEIITDYGFNVTGTQKLALKREDKQYRNELFTSILIIKLGIFILGLLIFTFILFFLNKYHKYALIFYYYYAYLLGSILISNWFYLGMEEMKYLNLPNLISKLFYIISILVFLKNKEQYYLIPIFFSLSYILAGLFSVFFLRIHYKISLKFKNFHVIWEELKDGWDIFLGTFLINIYRNLNVIILGLVSNNYFVGIYSAAEKIVKIIQSIMTPVNQALYPFISRKFKESEEIGTKYLKKITFFVGIFVAGISLSVFMLSPFIISLISREFIESVGLLKIMSFVVLFGSLNFIIGIIYMSNVGMKKWFLKAVAITGILNIIICALLSVQFQAIGAGVAFTLSEVILFTIMLSMILKYKGKRIIFA